MDKHLFSRWQVTLTALFVLADGLFLPLSRTGWMALLCAAAAAAALLFPLLRLPRSLRNAACALLALFLPLRSVYRLYGFWQYEGTQAALAVALLLLTAWFLARRGLPCCWRRWRCSAASPACSGKAARGRRTWKRRTPDSSGKPPA